MSLRLPGNERDIYADLFVCVQVSYIYSLGTEGSWMGKRLLEIVKG